MCEELTNFEYFRDHQLKNLCVTTGRLDTQRRKDVGSLNEDGYVRVWCGYKGNQKLRMKHRLVYFLKHGVLPEDGYEIDHIDRVRSNNAPSNLRVLRKGENNARSVNRKFGKQLSKEDVIKICELLANTDKSDLIIAEEVGRSRGTVRDIKTRRTRKAVSMAYTWTHREKQ